MTLVQGSVTAQGAGPGRTRIVIDAGEPVTAEQRAAQLTDRVWEVIEALNAAVARADEAVVVDVRTPGARGDAAWPNVQAFVEAVRGLVQSLTLELPSPAPAINIVVSSPAQESARGGTVEYLFSDDGRFSRGTTYDLRSER